MRPWRNFVWTACAAGLFILCSPAALSAATCDQYDPHGPSRDARVTLDSGDFVNHDGEEMRSFIDTGSIGQVEVAVVGSTPHDIVHGVTAAPAISRLSPYFGESLKGIAVEVTLGASRHPVKVVLDLRQVCAKRFINTFLYY